MLKKIAKQAFVSTVPVLAGYLVLGFGFGIILKANGYGIFLAFVMSLIIYAGSMQYVSIGLLTSGASLITTALTTLMVNARHLFYGISMLEKYKNIGKIKPYLIFALTDETYSLVCKDDPSIPAVERKNYYFLVSFFNQMYWIIGSVLGAVIGSFVKFNSDGIDFALSALFLTVFIEQWLTTSKHAPAIIGVVVSVISLILFGSEKFLIPTMLVISLLLCFYKEGYGNE
ncbi:MAG: branched-chain amino acid transporter AzlC [Ruminococcaceae bacterium]|nr:branched-chain amino acid transporter AzlC [Oscillospiraceae bacterium]